MYLIDATPLQSEHRLRGVGTYVRHLCEALLRQSPNNVRFILSSNSTRHLSLDMVERSIRAPRGHKPAQMYWLYNEVFLRQALLRGRPTVFHSTDFNGLVRFPGIRTVATLHDVMALKDVTGPRQTISERLSWWRWQIYFNKLRHADAIITVSDAVRADAVQHLGLDPDRITTIYPGVDIERFRPGKDLPSDLKLGRYFLCLGACQPNKNYPRILNAFAHLAKQFPDVALVLAGTWHPGQLEWLVRTAASLSVQKQLRHLGYVAPDLLPSLYANAVAFLFPSLDEGFGSPLVESMASGTPFITSNYGALKEVAGSSGLLVDPYDELSIASAMKLLLQRPRLRAALVESGLARSQLFSWDNVAEKTRQVYETVALGRTETYCMNDETGLVR